MFCESWNSRKTFIRIDVSVEELFASDHIKTNSELLDGINYYINSAKDDNKMLEKIYKIIRDLVEDVW